MSRKGLFGEPLIKIRKRREGCCFIGHIELAEDCVVEGTSKSFIVPAPTLAGSTPDCPSAWETWTGVYRPISNSATR